MSEPTDANALAFTTAQTYQQLAQASLEALRGQTEKLHLTIRDTARRAIQESLGALRWEIEATTVALHHLSRRTHRHLLWITPAAILTGLGLGIATAIGLATWRPLIASEAFPPPAAGADPPTPLSRCRDSHQHVRACVRVDLSAGAFGPHHDYFLLPQTELRP